MAITLKAMLEQMQSGEHFTCTVISYDKRRKKGGTVIEYGEARLYEPSAEQAATRAATEVERLRQRLSSHSRKPSHGKHFTRNIQLCVEGHPTSDIRKIHPPLVIKFNDQIVLG